MKNNTTTYQAPKLFMSSKDKKDLSSQVEEMLLDEVTRSGDLCLDENSPHYEKLEEVQENLIMVQLMEVVIKELQKKQIQLSQKAQKTLKNLKLA